MKEHKSTITLNNTNVELTYTLSTPVEDIGDLDIVQVNTVSGDDITELVKEMYSDELHTLLWDKLNDNEPCENERGCW